MLFLSVIILLICGISKRKKILIQIHQYYTPSLQKLHKNTEVVSESFSIHHKSFVYHRKTAPKINYKPNNVIYRHTPYIVRSYFPLSLILIPRLIVLLGVVGPITDDNWILLPERSRDTWHHPRDINCELNYCRLIKLIPGNIDYQTWALVRCVAISLINNMLLLLWKYI